MNEAGLGHTRPFCSLCSLLSGNEDVRHSPTLSQILAQAEILSSLPVYSAAASSLVSLAPLSKNDVQFLDAQSEELSSIRLQLTIHSGAIQRPLTTFGIDPPCPSCCIHSRVVFLDGRRQRFTPRNKSRNDFGREITSIVRFARHILFSTTSLSCPRAKHRTRATH